MLTLEQRLDRFMDSLEQARIDALRRHEQHEEEIRQLRLQIAQAEARRIAEREKREKQQAEREKQQAEEEALRKKKQEEEEARYKQWREEVDKQAKKEYAEIRALQRKSEGMFISKWGKLVEALVNNQLIPLLRERGIQVGDTTQRRSGCHQGVSYEFDIIAINGDTIVIVEVKTTLVPSDVTDFVEKLKHVRLWLPEYANKRIFGAVAYLHCDSSADRVAEKAGLFTILATGSSAKILNPQDFQPRNY